jgi:tetratricopeptide (TPR) repeat protein
MTSALLLAASLCVAAPSNPTSAKKLSAAVSAFKKNPTDANREAVILAARGAKLPESEEAERFEGRAEYAFKNAKSEADFAIAAAEYQKAVDVAPWVAANYFNLGVAQEKAGRLAPAIKSFGLYLKAAPDAGDAKEVRKRIAGLEMGLEQASNPASVAQRQSGFEGSWRESGETGDRGYRIVKNPDGSFAASQLAVGCTRLCPTYQAEVSGDKLILTEFGFCPTGNTWNKKFTGTLAQDGRTISGDYYHFGTCESVKYNDPGTFIWNRK